MKTWALLLAFCVGCTCRVHAGETLPPTSHPDSAKWTDLFAGDLSNAIYPQGVWSFAGGVLTATEDKNIWTQQEYRNVIVDLEFKNDVATNSGVIVYASDLKNWIPNSIEIQILDDFAPKWASAPKSWQCGAVFGLLPASKQVVRQPGQWNRMTVTCLGPMIHVLLNGESVNTFDMRKWTSAKKNPDGSDIPPWLNKPKAQLATKGRLGLQGKHSGAPIYFRNLKIKPLDD